jgi:hypothetical protein
VRALLIRHPHIDTILAGKKTWEIRGSKSLVRETIGLVASGSGTVIGVCELVDCVGPLTAEQFRKNATKAGMRPSESKLGGYLQTYAWVLEKPRLLKRPVPYEHPPGAVIWVTLDGRVKRKILKQLKAMANRPVILMPRERSSMVSCWNEMLCIKPEVKGKWSIGLYMYNIVASIYDVVAEDQLYDEDGEMNIPAEYNGEQIRGLTDNEYLETNELVHEPNDERVTFDASTLDLAHAYALNNGWDKEEGFEAAWEKLLKLVPLKPDQNSFISAKFLRFLRNPT